MVIIIVRRCEISAKKNKGLTVDRAKEIVDRDARPQTQIAVLAAIAVLCLITYANSLHGTFQFDDMRTIRFNFWLRELSNWKTILLSERFRPLLAATFALNYHIGKQDPFFYHVGNLFLHFTSVALFYLFLSRRSAGIVAALAAALMAVHPFNTEAVSYISSRSILLCSTFYFLALLFFDSYVQTKRRIYAAAFWSAFMVAAFTREEAAVIPVTAILYHWLFFGGDSVKKHRMFHLASILIVFAGASFRIILGLKYNSQFPYPLGVWIPTEAAVFLRYLGLAIYPAHLNVDPDIPSIGFASASFWISIAIGSAILWLLWKVRTKHPALTFWGLWFYLNLLPSSALPLLDFMAEHRAYLSLFGFCGCIVYSVLGFRKTASKPAIAALSVLIILSMVATIQRNRAWSNEFTLWYDSVQKSPHKIRPHLNLAAAYIQKAAYDPAIQEYILARDLNSALPHAYSGLGIFYLRKGDIANAEWNFRKALEIYPDLVDAKTGLGVVLYRKGNYEEALSYFTQVFAQRQESVQLMQMMIDSFQRTGRVREAEEMQMRLERMRR